MHCPARTRSCSVWLALLAIAVIGAAPLRAQTTTGGIRGTVSDDTGVLPGASVSARDKESGFAYEATSDGRVRVLRPVGHAARHVRRHRDDGPVQAAGADRAAAPRPERRPSTSASRPTSFTPSRCRSSAGTGRIIETKTSEISTSVTPEQVRYLPQNQRNFLNFANLAPGVKTSQDETRQEVTGGGLDATQVNVFIDGVSFKNDVLQGGVVGQDSSRGSPFPQSAVQEFQVLTQNFKAEHEKASSAVITAVTKSGTNRWAGDAFVLYQDENLVSTDKYSEGAESREADVSALAAGPVDRRTDHQGQLFRCSAPTRRTARIADEQVFLGGHAVSRFPAGSSRAPSRASSARRLVFAKGTYQPKVGQNVDVSYSLRTESDVRDFGGQNSFESGQQHPNRVDSVAWPLADSGTDLAQRPHGNLPAVQLESTPGQHRPDRSGVRRTCFASAAATRRRTSCSNAPRCATTTRATSSGAARTRFKAGGVLSFLDYDVREVPERQSALPAPLRIRSSSFRPRPVTASAIPI